MKLNTIIDGATKYNDVEKLEVMGFTLYEKDKPFYNSKIFGVPLKYIAMGIASYHIVRGIK
jgi:hypothetical protein